MSVQNRKNVDFLALHVCRDFWVHVFIVSCISTEQDLTPHGIALCFHALSFVNSMYNTVMWYLQSQSDSHIDSLIITRGDDMEICSAAVYVEIARSLSTGKIKGRKANRGRKEQNFLIVFEMGMEASQAHLVSFKLMKIQRKRKTWACSPWRMRNQWIFLKTHTLDKNGSLYDPAGTESWNMQIRNETTKITMHPTNNRSSPEWFPWPRSSSK